MRKIVYTAVLLAVTSLAWACHGRNTDWATGGEKEVSDIRKLYVGADLSMLPAYEKGGVEYRDISGELIPDMLSFLKSGEVGWNTVRVRLFVDPSRYTEKEPMVCQDLNYVTEFGKELKRKGYQFMLDFHYSDYWADPSKQFKPLSWEKASPKELADTIYNYTKRCLKHMAENQATPDLIQIGNEISFGMLWPEGRIEASDRTGNWDVFLSYLKNASRACREICPKAKIIVHTERAEDIPTTLNYYHRLKTANIDYDVIGLSYYPMWHSTLENLGRLISLLKYRFADKKVQIAEMAYHYNEPGEEAKDAHLPWATTLEGQANFVKALVNMLCKHDNVNGLLWWYPEENGYQNDVVKYWNHRGLWDNRTGKATPALYEMKRFAPVKTVK